MRKKYWMLSALVVCLAFTGCGNKEKETEVQTEVQTETESETEIQTETESETEVQTEPVIETGDSMNMARQLKGLVKSSDSTNLTIQTERGKELSFSTVGADIQAAGGIVAGNNVTIVYKGVIKDTDTSDVKVLMVKDLEAGETPVTEGELMEEAEHSDPNAGAGVLEGSIADVNMNRIVIYSNDGDPYYFMVYGTDINLRNGFQEGNYVTVDYNGDIHGPELVVAQAITDAQEEADKVESGATKDGEHSYVNGFMKECTIETVTIVTDDGEELTFNTTGATLCYSNGVADGNYLTVEFIGDLKGDKAEKVTVTAIYDYPDDSISQDFLYESGSSDDEYYDDEYYDEYYEDDYSDEEYYDEYYEE